MADAEAVKAAMTTSLDAEGVVRSWVNAGKPGGFDGLRHRLEKAADPAPIEEAVKSLRATGAASVK